MSLTWPESYQAIKDIIYSQWAIKGEIEILREFSDGRSNARVFEVDIQGRNHCGTAILKLDITHRGSNDSNKEAQRHVRAEQNTPEYALKHIPKMLDFCEHEGKTALLCSIAGNTLIYTQPLLRLDISQQIAAIQRIASGILEEWNKNYTVSDQACIPYDALISWLGYRIYPNLGGQIQDFLQDKCGLGQLDLAFSFLGEWFLNPYAYVVSRELWPSGHEVKLVKGNSHGDLHGHNILVKIEGPYGYAYYLIDLALYEDNSYLFYDHAYLELSHLLHYRGNVQFTRWLQILQALTGIQSVDIALTKVEPDDHGLLRILDVARQEILNWVQNHEPARQDHLKGQTILARVAIGLNFVNKEIDDNQRKLAFLYAAANLKLYFTLFRLQWEQKGPVLNLREPIEIPETDNWREVWNASDHFDHYKNVYILVNGPEVRQVNPAALKILGRIPWSLVLDFDPGSKSGGLFEAVHLTLQKFRAPHVTLPDNLQEINYKEATCWFMAAGMNEREDTLRPNYDAWRREYLSNIRKLSHMLKKSVSPQPVLVLIAIDGLTEQYLRAIWECLDEVFEDEARYVVVHNGGINLEHIKDKPGITTVQCPLTNLMSGLWQMYGSTLKAEQISVPKRGISENERGALFLEDCDFQYLKEDLEVIHRGLVEEQQDERRVGHDFWRGYEVTWTELDMGADVRRELAEPLKKEILARLGESRNVSIPLYHTPGAGGTTLAKRIAWDLKDLYPTVRIHHLSQYTSSRIEMLFHKTGLPLLVLMEAANVPQPAREQLYKELKGRNIRAVFLYIVRNIKPRGGFSLADPIIKLEANRFYERYKNFAPSSRVVALERLAHDEQFRPYRSPFFFGLYAFEKEFIHIPDYVKSHLTYITTEDAKKIMCFLALVTRFSQMSLTDYLIKGILSLQGKRPLHLNEIFGEGPSRLILHRDQKARIVHPLIAQEILKQLLASNNTKEEWKTRLVDLSCLFIESLVNIAGTESTIVLEILSQMFVSRDPWQERTDRRRNFSELILEIPNDAGQHRILQKLKDFCHNEAHFWNHLGRHHIYVMRSKYDEAEKCLTRAIELDSKNDVHYHALGMVYRFEIKKQLDALIIQRVTAELGLNKVRELLNKAEGCFEKARELDPETEYGYITHIQLLIEIIERLFRLSGFENYKQFLTNTELVATWCRDKLPWAEELLRKVKNLHAQENLSRLTVQCEANILNFYGSFESMIQSLQRLLQRTDIQHPPIRRVIANAYYAHRNHNWKAMESLDLSKIHSLMTKNLEEYPSTDRDLWMWLQAYRRLSSFNILEAIDQLNRWAMREESLEANYYLYILHFIRWRQGILDDYRPVVNHIRKCQSLAGKISRTRSYEWLAKEPSWCPLAHQSELGEWNDKINFYQNTEPLASINGMVKLIKGPQSGLLALGPFEVFFVPGNELLPGRDENKEVQIYLGFSYDGLRGWNIQHINR